MSIKFFGNRKEQGVLHSMTLLEKSVMEKERMNEIDSFIFQKLVRYLDAEQIDSDIKRVCEETKITLLKFSELKNCERVGFLFMVDNIEDLDYTTEFLESLSSSHNAEVTLAQWKVSIW